MTDKSEITPERIGFRKLVNAVKNCEDEIQDKVLEEYKQL